MLAYFLVQGPPVVGLGELLMRTGAYMAASFALFQVLDHAFHALLNRLVTVYAAVALNLYYWFAGLKLAASLLGFGLPVPGATVWALRLLVAVLSAVWIVRTWRNEGRFLAQIGGQLAAVNVQVGGAAESALKENASRQPANLRIEPDVRTVIPKPTQTVLDVVQGCGLRLESGCRMGVCGADPVAVTAGMDALSPVGGDEKSTLERLGFAKNTRLACCARIQGAVTVELKPHLREAPPAAAPVKFDSAIKRVVVVGTGIASVTAADHVRRRHPECEVHLVGREPHLLYNRMGISRLIYGQSGMQGLYLMPESWYAEHNITLWLNTIVTRIDAAARQVELATGEKLPYDRLVLANGSSSVVPALEGFGARGTYVLREADDAIAIRKYVQETGAKHIVIAGAGLLGLEAAYALKKIGASPSVLGNSARILNRQLDEASASLLGQYLNGLGIHILVQSQAARLETKNGAVTAVHLQDGRILPCELFLVCIGVRPNLDLARDAGLAVKKGVLVNDAMQTSDPFIFAAGDIAEHKGELWGLWPVAVEQAEIAAANALGETRAFAGFVPTTLLKVVGADVMSVGRFEEAAGDEVVLQPCPEKYQYRKLIVRDGKLVGAILIGHPADTALIAKTVKAGRDVTAILPRLRVGDLALLETV